MEGSSNSKKSVPVKGKVNEMCREWLVREDGAFAYHLQAQEISQFYSSNKNRNQQVREDFPCALDEQLREHQMAEQAAAVYQRMLLEQEEGDEQIARELAERIEREEEQRKRTVELRDENIARQLLHKDGRDRLSGPKMPAGRVEYVGNQPRRQAPQMPLPKSKMMDIAVQQRQASNGVDRERDSGNAPKPPPKPPQPAAPCQAHAQHNQSLPGSADDYHDLYTEPYQAPTSTSSVPNSRPPPQLTNININVAVVEQLASLDISSTKDKQSPPRSLSNTNTSVDNMQQQQQQQESVNQSSNSPIATAQQIPIQQSHQMHPRDRSRDHGNQHQHQQQHQEQQQVLMSPTSPTSSSLYDDEEDLRRLQQEERDAEFARQLQEQESNSEESIMIRDRMLAMEAQDKELARLLQEREKAKARRAKERAKQRALQKKMALEHQSQPIMQGPDCILLPDDSYSSPVDLLPPKTTIPHTMPSTDHHPPSLQPTPHQHDLLDDAASNYSLPVDTLLQHGHQQQAYPTEQAVSGVRSVAAAWADQEQMGELFGSGDDGMVAPPVVAPTRPTQLDLRTTTTTTTSSHQKISKPRYPDPPAAATTPATPAPRCTISPLDYQLASPNLQQQQQHYQQKQSGGSSRKTNAMPTQQQQQQQHANIAMAIDPTYGRRHQQQQQQVSQGGGYYQPAQGHHQGYHHQHQPQLQQYLGAHNGHAAMTENIGSPQSNNTTPGSPCTPSTGYTTTSTSSSITPPQHEDDGGDDCGGGSPVPPYMPIQGQRRLGTGLDVGYLHQYPQGVDVVGGVVGAPACVPTSTSAAGKGRKKHGRDGGGGCKQQ